MRRHHLNTSRRLKWRDRLSASSPRRSPAAAKAATVMRRHGAGARARGSSPPSASRAPSRCPPTASASAWPAAACTGAAQPRLLPVHASAALSLHMLLHARAALSLHMLLHARATLSLHMLLHARAALSLHMLLHARTH